MQHRPTELYVTYAQSFKGGGFNNQRQTLQLAVVRQEQYVNWWTADWMSIFTILKTKRIYTRAIMAYTKR